MQGESQHPRFAVWVVGFVVGFALQWMPQRAAELIPWGVGHDRILLDFALMSIPVVVVVALWSFLHPRMATRVPVWLGILASASIMVAFEHALEDPHAITAIGPIGSTLWGPMLVFPPALGAILGEVILALGRRRRVAPAQQALPADAGSR